MLFLVNNILTHQLLAIKMSALVLLLASTPSEFTRHVQRRDARLRVLQCHDKLTKLLNGNHDYAQIVLDTVVSV
jgi:hypothetical protein